MVHIQRLPSPLPRLGPLTKTEMLRGPDRYLQKLLHMLTFSRLSSMGPNMLFKLTFDMSTKDPKPPVADAHLQAMGWGLPTTEGPAASPQAKTPAPASSIDEEMKKLGWAQPLVQEAPAKVSRLTIQILESLEVVSSFSLFFDLLWL